MLRHLHRPLVVTAGAMGLLVILSAIGLAVDDRMLAGVPIWLKPLKFSLSIVIYALTLAWLIGLVEQRRRRPAWWLGTVVSLCLAGEMVAIVAQVLRGRQSHFNVATPLDASIYSAMGATIMVVWVCTLGLGFILLRQPLGDRAGALAIRLGLGIAVAGMAVGFLMTTSPTPEQLAVMQAGQAPTLVGAHGVGVVDGGPGLPFVNWSTLGGDLRIGHFIGMHALQALPLLALGLAAAGRRFGRFADERLRTRLVLVAGLAYGGFTGLVTWQALRGQSIVQPDVLTVAAALAGVAATVAGVIWAGERAQPATATGALGEPSFHERSSAATQ